jgi:hypothetical protein
MQKPHPEIERCQQFKPGDMVQIAGRKSGRGKLVQAARLGMVVKPYEPTGAAWITRVQVLVEGKLEDINVGWLTKHPKKKHGKK